MDKKKKELKKIRKERKNLFVGNTKNKLQKRRIEIVEYEDGTYSLIGYAWNLPLKSEEVIDAFQSWLDGSLENGITPKNI